MQLDPRIVRAAPPALAVVILAAGWMLLVQPRFAESTRAGREVDGLRQRLMMVQRSVAEPLPPAPATDPAVTFEREVAAGDASAQLLEQLARLAAAAPATNLLIETGERVTLTSGAPSGPQAGSVAVPDPRFRLFNTPLTYSPVTMSFDAEYARVGEVLWALRDLATTVELRRVEARPVENTQGRVHVTVTLFAYARPRPAAGSAGAQR
jgi:hypothetical protein